MMKTPHPSFRLRQQGIVTVMVAIILIAAVIFVLSQTLGITGSSSTDSGQQMAGTEALFIAESGLERGQGLISAAANPAAASACTGVTGSFPLGKGTVNLSNVSTPAGCTTACTGCTITSTGTVGSSSRTVTRTIAITPGSSGGVSCNSATTNCTNLTANPPSVPPTWSLTVTNTTGQPALALLHLAATRQGNPSAANCTAQSNCQLKWVINSQNGDDSVVSMGNLYSLAVGASTPNVFQTITSSRPEDVAFSAILLPGNINPTMVGAYWDDTTNGSGGTHGKEHDNGGTTNNGAATSSGNCTTNPAPAPSTTQACTNWCYGGDRLVFGFAGAGNRENAVADMLTSVTFNTNGNPSQNIALTRISHFPTPSTPGASAKIYSELWSVYNPAYLYGAKATGSIAQNVSGPAFTASTTSGSSTLTVTTAPGPKLISVGDTIAGAGIPPGTKIVSQNSGSTGLTGTYTISANATATATGISMASTRTELTVTAVDGGTLGVGQTLSSSAAGTDVTPGTTIVALGTGSGSTGTYYLSTAQTVTSRTIISGATSSGTTISVPNGPLPGVGTIVAVRADNGFGRFTAKATVQSVNSANNTFVVDANPSTALNGAQICGGTCAFFDHTSATTNFSIVKPAETDSWASGFICVSGADLAPVIGSTGSALNATTWSEVVK